MGDAHIVSIQVGKPQAIGSDTAAEPMDRPWFSGFYKLPISGPVHVGTLGLDGDGQADHSVHGGPDRPVLAYCAEHYAKWKAELGLDEMPAGGSFGENLTVSGLDEQTVCLGDRYAVGPVIFEVSQPRQPCWKLARRWRNKQLPALVIEHNRGGWYFRTIQEGSLQIGMPLRLIDRPCPSWTIANANAVMYQEREDATLTRALANVGPLSEDWRNYFERRLAAAG